MFSRGFGRKIMILAFKDEPYLELWYNEQIMNKKNASLGKQCPLLS